jgi:hypothetical protein
MTKTPRNVKGQPFIDEAGAGPEFNALLPGARNVSGLLPEFPACSRKKMLPHVTASGRDLKHDHLRGWSVLADKDDTIIGRQCHDADGSARIRHDIPMSNAVVRQSDDLVQYLYGLPEIGPST